jgi:DNA-binding XRE family transcriptional regulator
MSIEKDYDKLIKATSERIKFFRLSCEYSQKDMETFGFDVKNYQKLEYGKHHYSLYTLFKLSRIFKCSLNDLLVDEINH